MRTHRLAVVRRRPSQSIVSPELACSSGRGLQVSDEPAREVLSSTSWNAQDVRRRIDPKILNRCYGTMLTLHWEPAPSSEGCARSRMGTCRDRAVLWLLTHRRRAEQPMHIIQASDAVLIRRPLVVIVKPMGWNQQTMTQLFERAHPDQKRDVHHSFERLIIPIPAMIPAHDRWPV